MDRPADSLEIRGCMFYNTAIQELYMSGHITKILSEYGIECANRPIGFWEYPRENQIYEQNNIKNESPDIEKICTVFETLGEKRAGTHLIQGLNMLLWAFTKRYHKETNYQALKDLFPESRHEKDEIIPTMEAVMFYDLPENVTLAQKCASPVYDKSFLANLAVKDSLLDGTYQWGGMISNVPLNQFLGGDETEGLLLNLLAPYKKAGLSEDEKLFPGENCK